MKSPVTTTLFYFIARIAGRHVLTVYGREQERISRLFTEFFFLVSFNQYAQSSVVLYVFLPRLSYFRCLQLSSLELILEVFFITCEPFNDARKKGFDGFFTEFFLVLNVFGHRFAITQVFG